jgi:hypothetical protein
MGWLLGVLGWFFGDGRRVEGFDWLFVRELLFFCVLPVFLFVVFLLVWYGVVSVLGWLL